MPLIFLSSATLFLLKELQFISKFIRNLYIIIMLYMEKDLNKLIISLKKIK